MLRMFDQAYTLRLDLVLVLVLMLAVDRVMDGHAMRVVLGLRTEHVTGEIGVVGGQLLYVSRRATGKEKKRRAKNTAHRSYSENRACKRIAQHWLHVFPPLTVCAIPVKIPQYSVLIDYAIF